MSFAQLIIQADGGSRGNPGKAGFGAVVLSVPQRTVLARRAGYLGTATNNFAEYHGLLAGIKAALQINPEAELLVELDSNLVVQQMSGAWKIKHADMQALALQARELTRGKRISYRWIPRAENSLADALANKAMDEEGDFSQDFWNQSSQQAASGETTQNSTSGFSTLYLVRHGETAMTRSGQFSGSTAPGPQLSELGIHQARNAAKLVTTLWREEVFEPAKQWEKLLVSPLARTKQTAEPVSQDTGLTPQNVPELVEVGFGQWQGLTQQEIAQQWPGQLESWFNPGTTPAPGTGGESLEQVAARVWPILQDLATQSAGRPSIVVAHSVVIRAGIGQSLGLRPEQWARMRVLPGSVSVIQFGPQGAQVPVVGQIPLGD